VIDRESERVVSGWVRLGDRVVGRKTEEGRCDRCGSVGQIAQENGRRLCARCHLEGASSSET
jgi:ribosomal protein S27AE